MAPTTPRVEQAVVARAAAAVTEAGELLTRQRGDASRRMKSTHGDAIDYATETDLAAEALLRERLLHDGYRFHGEETAGDDVLDGWCWVVDPIDGTLNWANNLPMCAISVGLCHDGVPVLGVIHTPLLGGQTWIGVVGEGARRNGVPVRVNEVDPAEAVIAYDGIRGGGPDPYLHAIRRSVGRHRLLGSTATEMALCADGGFAAVVAPNAMFWDVAAGIALVRAAGGTAVGLDGGEPRPGNGSVIAGASRTVDAIVGAIRDLPPMSGR